MSEKILVIDKDTTALRKIREVLTREGYSVMTAVDIATARQICRQIPVKYVLGESDLLDCGTKSISQ